MKRVRASSLTNAPREHLPILKAHLKLECAKGEKVLSKCDVAAICEEVMIEVLELEAIATENLSWSDVTNGDLEKQRIWQWIADQKGCRPEIHTPSFSDYISLEGCTVYGSHSGDGRSWSSLGLAVGLQDRDPQIKVECIGGEDVRVVVRSGSIEDSFVLPAPHLVAELVKAMTELQDGPAGKCRGHDH